MMKEASTSSGVVMGWRRSHTRFVPHAAARARSPLRDILSPSHEKLHELTGGIEHTEDLMRRYCRRRGAQGRSHTIADDIRMSSLDKLSLNLTAFYETDWIKISVGTGAGTTAWSMIPHTRHRSLERTVPIVRTATGEIVHSGPRVWQKV